MKRGGFWMTTVGASLVVVALMAVGRAGLQSHAALFLQGQMKIAAGDTSGGLKLLSQAAGQREQLTVAPVVQKAAAGAAEPCSRSVGRQKASRSDAVLRDDRAVVTTHPAPEPTMAALNLPEIPVPPIGEITRGVPYVSAVQRHNLEESLRAHQAEILRAQKAGERQVKQALREISLKYGSSQPPNAEQIKIELPENPGSWAR